MGEMIRVNLTRANAQVARPEKEIVVDTGHVCEYEELVSFWIAPESHMNRGLQGSRVRHVRASWQSAANGPRLLSISHSRRSPLNLCNASMPLFP